jgi:hypothetical protein
LHKLECIRSSILAWQLTNQRWILDCMPSGLLPLDSAESASRDANSATLYSPHSLPNSRVPTV